MIEINLDGAKNIRDFGNTITKDGNTIKRNKLIRSSPLNSITDSDVKILINEYILGTVIDLRTEGEIKEKPDIIIPGVKYYNFSLIPGILFGITHEEKTYKNIYSSKTS